MESFCYKNPKLFVFCRKSSPSFCLHQKKFGSCQKSKQTLCLNVAALHSLVNKKLPKHYQISHQVKYFSPKISFDNDEIRIAAGKMQENTGILFKKLACTRTTQLKS